METQQIDGRTRLVADIVALKGGAIPLIVGVKAMRGAMEIGVPWLAEEIGQIASDGFEVEFGMFVDREEIRIFKVHEAGPNVLCTLSTAEVLVDYEPEFGRWRISKDYLQALVGVWLSYFTGFRQGRTPPASDQFRKIGLAARLEGARIEEHYGFILR